MCHQQIGVVFRDVSLKCLSNMLWNPDILPDAEIYQQAFHLQIFGVKASLQRGSY